MCFGSPKPPTPQAVPPISPPPTITPTNVSDVSAQETARKQRVAQLRYGFASTIKTSPQGITGTGSDVQPSNTGSTTKTTLG